MRKIKYPLIVSDFDGTLVKNDGTIDEYTKQTILQYIQDGGRFAISTGRMPSGILSRAKELGLKGLVCCCQGAVIADIETEEILFEGRLHLEAAIKVAKKLEEMDLHTQFYDLWEYYANKNNEVLKIYEKIVGSKAIVIEDMPITEFLQKKQLHPFKFLMLVDPKDNEKIMKELEGENFEGCSITRSSEFMVEVCNANYSKGTAVARLAKEYGIPLEKTIAVGDQLNDLPMLETAGLGVAVKNAEKALQEKTYVYEYSNDEDAVAKLIKEYGYTGEK